MLQPAKMSTVEPPFLSSKITVSSREILIQMQVCRVTCSSLTQHLYYVLENLVNWGTIAVLQTQEVCLISPIKNKIVYMQSAPSSWDIHHQQDSSWLKSASTETSWKGCENEDPEDWNEVLLKGINISIHSPCLPHKIVLHAHGIAGNFGRNQQSTQFQLCHLAWNWLHLCPPLSQLQWFHVLVPWGKLHLPIHSAWMPLNATKWKRDMVCSCWWLFLF